MSRNQIDNRCLSTDILWTRVLFVESQNFAVGSRESHSGSDNQSETASTETQQRSSVLSSVGQGPAFQGPSSASASTNDVDDRPPQANREVVGKRNGLPGQ